MHIGHKTRIGDRVKIGAKTRIGDLVTLGDGVQIGKHVCIDDRVKLPRKYKIDNNTLVRYFESNSFAELFIGEGEVYELVDGMCKEVVDKRTLADLKPCTKRTKYSKKFKSSAMCGQRMLFGYFPALGHNSTFGYKVSLGDNVIVKDDVNVGAFAGLGDSVILEEGVCVEPRTQLPHSVRIKRNRMVRLKLDGDEFEYDEIPARNGMIFVMENGHCKEVKKSVVITIIYIMLSIISFPAVFVLTDLAGRNHRRPNPRMTHDDIMMHRAVKGVGATATRVPEAIGAVEVAAAEIHTNHRALE